MEYNRDLQDIANGLGSVFMGVLILFALSIMILLVVSYWKIFQKAGREGWEAIIPFYNSYVLMEISGKPGWWAFISFIPCIGIVGIVLHIIAQIELAKKFGKDGGFTVGLILLPFIFYPILAFGDAVYNNASDPVTQYISEDTTPQ